MKMALGLLVALVACGGPSEARRNASPPAPAPAPSAPVERFWLALRDRDVALFETVFSRRELSELRRDGMAHALDAEVAFPLTLLDAAGVVTEEAERAELARWNERIPIDRFSYQFHGGDSAGQVLAYLPAEVADRVPHPTAPPTSDGRVLIWNARVVREPDGWKLDEQ